MTAAVVAVVVVAASVVAAVVVDVAAWALAAEPDSGPDCPSLMSVVREGAAGGAVDAAVVAGTDTG